MARWCQTHERWDAESFGVTGVLNPVDVLLVVVLLISLGVAFLRGLVQEAMSLATWIAAAGAGYLFAEPLQPYLAGLVTHQIARRVLAGSLIFVLVLILGGLLNRFLSRGVRRLGLGGMDRLLGLGFGTLRAIALITVVVMLIQLTRLPEHEWWVQSRLLPYFLPLATQLQAALPAEVVKPDFPSMPDGG